MRSQWFGSAIDLQVKCGPLKADIISTSVKGMYERTLQRKLLKMDKHCLLKCLQADEGLDCN